MWALPVWLLFMGHAHAWPRALTCKAPHENNRWHLRQELDKLSRFTGHDQFDKYTKHWMRQQAMQFSVSLGVCERVASLRLLPGNRLAILSDRRRWEVDLLTGHVTSQQQLCRHGKYTLSMDGCRLYHAAYDASMDCHVIKCNDSPVVMTDSFPYHVTESVDGGTACIGLCSETVLVASLDDQRRHWDVERVCVHDVALASAGLRGKTFHGLLGGRIAVRDGATGKWASHALRPPSGPAVAPSVRSLDVDMFGFKYVCFVGRQDGVVSVCRYDETPDGDDLAELSSRRLHRFPVTKIRCSHHRVASGDDEGHVVVSDMHGTKTMYSLHMDGPGDVCFDLDQRFLVVGRGNVVRVWDHDYVPVLRPPRSRATKPRGDGGSSVLR